jgi:hypothetical protein
VHAAALVDVHPPLLGRDGTVPSIASRASRYASDSIRRTVGKSSGFQAAAPDPAPESLEPRSLDRVISRGAACADTAVIRFPRYEGGSMRSHHNGGEAKLALATILAVAVGLVGASGASAAPGDNIRNAGKCLHGGWQTLQTSTGKNFNGPLGCVVYALSGRAFGAVVTPPVTPPSE